METTVIAEAAMYALKNSICSDNESKVKKNMPKEKPINTY
jgi:hypothetical protein